MLSLTLELICLARSLQEHLIRGGGLRQGRGQAGWPREGLVLFFVPGCCENSLDGNGSWEVGGISSVDGACSQGLVSCFHIYHVVEVMSSSPSRNFHTNFFLCFSLPQEKRGLCSAF